MDKLAGPQTRGLRVWRVAQWGCHAGPKTGALEDLEKNDTYWLTRVPGLRGGNRLEQPGQTPGDQWATLVTPFHGPPWPRLKMEAMLRRSHGGT